MPFPAASSVLEGITVLDLTRVRAGPTCTRQLGDWGAEVIKVEFPESLSHLDHLTKNREGSDFINLHRNKRSLTVNLKAPEGLALFKRLSAQADVIVENFRPDVKHKLGIDYDSLSLDNPRLIYASISGFGQEGPYRDRPGFDQIAQGLGGLMSITGLPGQGPVRVGIPIADLTSGIFASIGVLLALWEREKSGHGQWLHTSLLEAMVFMLDFQAARWLVEGEIPGQAGNNHPTSIPTGVFETKDGTLNIAAVGEDIWGRLCATLEAPHLLENPNYSSNDNRSKHREALNAEINLIIKTRTSEDWVTRLNKAGVPCGAINRMDQVFADPQVQHSGLVQTIDGETSHPLHLVGQPVTLTRTPSTLQTRPPQRGEHTAAILQKFGLSAQEIEELREKKVI